MMWELDNTTTTGGRAMRSVDKRQHESSSRYDIGAPSYIYVRDKLEELEMRLAQLEELVFGALGLDFDGETGEE